MFGSESIYILNYETIYLTLNTFLSSYDAFLYLGDTQFLLNLNNEFSLITYPIEEHAIIYSDFITESMYRDNYFKQLTYLIFLLMGNDIWEPICGPTIDYTRLSVLDWFLAIFYESRILNKIFNHSAYIEHYFEVLKFCSIYMDLPVLTDQPIYWIFPNGIFCSSLPDFTFIIIAKDIFAIEDGFSFGIYFYDLYNIYIYLFYLIYFHKYIYLFSYNFYFYSHDLYEHRDIYFIKPLNDFKDITIRNFINYTEIIFLTVFYSHAVLYWRGKKKIIYKINNFEYWLDCLYNASMSNIYYSYIFRNIYIYLQIFIYSILYIPFYFFGYLFKNMGFLEMYIYTLVYFILYFRTYIKSNNLREYWSYYLKFQNSYLRFVFLESWINLYFFFSNFKFYESIYTCERLLEDPLSFNKETFFIFGYLNIELPFNFDILYYKDRVGYGLFIYLFKFIYLFEFYLLKFLEGFKFNKFSIFLLNLFLSLKEYYLNIKISEFKGFFILNNTIFKLLFFIFLILFFKLLISYNIVIFSFIYFYFLALFILFYTHKYNKEISLITYKIVMFLLNIYFYFICFFLETFFFFIKVFIQILFKICKFFRYFIFLAIIHYLGLELFFVYLIKLFVFEQIDYFIDFVSSLFFFFIEYSNSPLFFYINGIEQNYLDFYRTYRFFTTSEVMPLNLDLINMDSSKILTLIGEALENYSGFYLYSIKMYIINVRLYMQFFFYSCFRLFFFYLFTILTFIIFDLYYLIVFISLKLYFFMWFYFIPVFFINKLFLNIFYSICSYLLIWNVLDVLTFFYDMSLFYINSFYLDVMICYYKYTINSNNYFFSWLSFIYFYKDIFINGLIINIYTFASYLVAFYIDIYNYPDVIHLREYLNVLYLNFYFYIQCKFDIIFFNIGISRFYYSFFLVDFERYNVYDFAPIGDSTASLDSFIEGLIPLTACVVADKGSGTKILNFDLNNDYIFINIYSFINSYLKTEIIYTNCYFEILYGRYPHFFIFLCFFLFIFITPLTSYNQYRVIYNPSQSKQIARVSNYNSEYLWDSFLLFKKINKFKFIKDKKMVKYIINKEEKDIFESFSNFSINLVLKLNHYFVYYFNHKYINYKFDHKRNFFFKYENKELLDITESLNSFLNSFFIFDSILFKNKQSLKKFNRKKKKNFSILKRNFVLNSFLFYKKKSYLNKIFKESKSLALKNFKIFKNIFLDFSWDLVFQHNLDKLIKFNNVDKINTLNLLKNKKHNYSFFLSFKSSLLKIYIKYFYNKNILFKALWINNKRTFALKHQDSFENESKTIYNFNIYIKNLFISLDSLIFNNRSSNYLLHKSPEFVFFTFKNTKGSLDSNVVYKCTNDPYRIYLCIYFILWAFLFDYITMLKGTDVTRYTLWNFLMGIIFYFEFFDFIYIDGDILLQGSDQHWGQLNSNLIIGPYLKGADRFGCYIDYDSVLIDEMLNPYFDYNNMLKFDTAPTTTNKLPVAFSNNIYMFNFAPLYVKEFFYTIYFYFYDSFFLNSMRIYIFFMKLIFLLIAFVFFKKYKFLYFSNISTLNYEVYKYLKVKINFFFYYLKLYIKKNGN